MHREETAVETPDKQLASALGRVASGLFVLTLQRETIATGMLASWVQQCSFQPPRVSVAIQPKRELTSLLGPGQTFTLNLLEDGQTDMVAHFGRGFALKDDAFVDLDIRREGTGIILTEALAYLHCKVVERVSAGDR